MTLAPPVTPADQADSTLARDGFAVLGAAAVSQLLGQPSTDLNAWLPFWDQLPPALYLRDGGRYRRRRHGCFVVEGDAVTQVPHGPRR